MFALQSTIKEQLMELIAMKKGVPIESVQKNYNEIHKNNLSRADDMINAMIKPEE